MMTEVNELLALLQEIRDLIDETKSRMGRFALCLAWTYRTGILQERRFKKAFVRIMNRRIDYWGQTCYNTYISIRDFVRNLPLSEFQSVNLHIYHVPIGTFFVP